jgi:uncharacterized protein (DUF488 family)
MATLFTVGYEGSNPSDLFASLQDNGVTLLIDVRDVPISRKPGFSKTSLSLGLDVAGIRPRRSQAGTGRRAGGSFLRLPSDIRRAHDDYRGAASLG